MLKENLSKVKNYLKEKLIKYKTILIIILILGVGYVYRNTLESKQKKEVESNISKEEVNDTKTQTILINTNLYNKTEKERRNYLLSNFDMDNVVNNEKATITIIDYSSFSCSYCKKMRKEINKIIDEYVIDKKIARYILRPVYNVKTIPYGAFLLCTKLEQRKEIAEIFFNPELNKFKNTEDYLLSIAKKFNFNEEYIKNCIHDEDNYSKIMYMQNESSKIFNLRGTPVLVINGKEYPGYKDYKKLKDIIETTIKKDVK